MDDQITLLGAKPPPTHDLIDLRCCSADDLLGDLHEAGVVADLAIADPPWAYSAGRPGHGRAEDHYATIPIAEIAGHIARTWDVAGHDSYLALWCTWPFLMLWAPRAGPWEYISGGSWHKNADGRQIGTGYHWRGETEPLLLYRKGRPRPHATIRNGFATSRASNAAVHHSRKPVVWQADMIRAWCPPGGLVLDLYAGLGSVAEAVLMAGGGRRYVGAEIDPERHAQALALLAQVRG